MPRSSLIVGVIAVLAGVLFARGASSPMTVRAEDIWDVIVGGDGPQTGITTYAYWPNAITIHAGDTVRWSFFSAIERHTVSFMRDDPSPPQYVPGPGAGEYTLGPAWYPIGTIENLGTFDNSQDLSSGAEFGPAQPVYTLTFSTPGVYTYRCLIHPGMVGTVTVVDGEATLSETREQALARGQHDFKQRLDALSAQIAQQNPPPGINPPGPLGPDVNQAGTESGAAVHTVDAGRADPDGAGALQFFPSSLIVRRGDTVIWTNTDPFGPHTVTFTSGAPAPDAPAVRNSGAPQLVLTADVVGPSGGSSYTGAGYVNSGLLQPAASFALIIDAPPGTYDYVSLLQPDVMHGSITVLAGSNSR